MKLIIEIEGADIELFTQVQKEVMISNIMSDVSDEISDYWLDHAISKPFVYENNSWQGSKACNVVAKLKVEDSK